MSKNGVFDNRGGVFKATPLIDFDVIIDEDLSLLAYVIGNIRNPEIFDLDKVANMDKLELLSESYLRKYRNPLHIIMKDNKYKDFLDQCYSEFKENGEFLDYFAIETHFYNVLEEYKKSSEVNSTILYHNDKQKQIIDNDEFLSSLLCTRYEDIENIEFYSQFYFRYIDDAEKFTISRLNRRTFYFSTSGPNINENSDSIIESKILQKISDNVNQINLFDLYNHKITGKAIK